MKKLKANAIIAGFILCITILMLCSFGTDTAFIILSRYKLQKVTEAMAFGVVPIVSQAGFNASICGDNQLVVNELSPHLFAQRIIDIEKKGEWEYFSRFVYNRVIEQFTEKQALEKLKQALRTVGINCGD